MPLISSIIWVFILFVFKYKRAYLINALYLFICCGLSNRAVYVCALHVYNVSCFAVTHPNFPKREPATLLALLKGETRTTPLAIYPCLYFFQVSTPFFSLFVCLMVFNAIFNNISVISWRSVLLVKETGGSGENHRPVASHWQTLSHNIVRLILIEIRTHISGDRYWLHR